MSFFYSFLQLFTSLYYVRRVARNLKFYPLSFKNAMAPGAPFNYIASTFHVKLCTEEKKLFADCTTWELLNLDPAVVLDLSGRLTTEYGMSTDYVQKVMTDYIIQTVGKDALEKQFGITIPACYYVATTQHYSWPKGAGKLYPSSSLKGYDLITCPIVSPDRHR